MTQEQHFTKSEELIEREAQVLNSLDATIRFYFLTIERQAKLKLRQTLFTAFDASRPVSQENVNAPIRNLFTKMTEPNAMFSIMATNEEGDVIIFLDDLDEEAPSEIINKAVKLCKDHSAEVVVSGTYHVEFTDIADPEKGRAVTHKELPILILSPDHE